MEQLIKDILNYMKTGQVELVLSDYDLSEEKLLSFNTMIIDLLSWIKLEHKRSEWKKEKKYVKLKPLDLNMNYTWCQLLNDIVKKDKRFSKLFIIEGNKFDFNNLVNFEDRALAKKFAFDNYNPKRCVR